jgi:hypothetical protein
MVHRVDATVAANMYTAPCPVLNNVHIDCHLYIVGPVHPHGGWGREDKIVLPLFFLVVTIPPEVSSRSFLLFYPVNLYSQLASVLKIKHFIYSSSGAISLTSEFQASNVVPRME